jgi:hypothetical protein
MEPEDSVHQLRTSESGEAEAMAVVVEKMQRAEREAIKVEVGWNGRTRVSAGREGGSRGDMWEQLA